MNKITSNSYEFPLSSHCKLNSPSPDKYKGIKSFANIKNGYSKDLPTYMQLGYLKENPLSYSSNHIKTPQAYQSKLNDNQFLIEHIRMIDQMKKDVGYIKENPSICNNIPSYNEIDFMEKRERLNNYRSDNKENIRLNIFDMGLKDKINKKHYKITPTLNSRKNDFAIYEFDKENFTNLKNMHDYELYENQSINKGNIIVCDRKPLTQFDCITQEYSTINPDCYVQDNLPKYYKK